MPPSKHLGALTVEERATLEQRLAFRQSGRCFICDDPLDLMLQKGQLDVDHIDPLAEDGLDAENNFALTHQSCNRSKGAANLHVARRINEFERLQEQAHLVKTGGRLVKHARYYWLLLAENHLTRRLCGAMLQRIWALPVPAG